MSANSLPFSLFFRQKTESKVKNIYIYSHKLLFMKLNVTNLYISFKKHASSDVEKMVLGNKCDMEDRRLVSKERGTQLATEYGIKFMETSAKASINVEEVGTVLLRLWFDLLDLETAMLQSSCIFINHSDAHSAIWGAQVTYYVTL